MKKEDFKIAYLSMEIALENKIKTYSGGLGVLAGDILRSSADLKLPMLGVTMLSKEGYFDQKVSFDGVQSDAPVKNYDFSKLKKLKEKIFIKIKNDKVYLNIWQYNLVSKNGHTLPIFLLDTDLTVNKKEYRGISNNLYGGDKHQRMLQEIILGRGAYEALKALGFDIKTYHINEGHGSFLTIAKFLDSKNRSIKARINEVRESCVFTTHTPVKEAHDIFPLNKVKEYQRDFPLKIPGLLDKDSVNMTKLGMFFSHYTNSVALSHQKVTKEMFPEFEISNVTNGVHSETWTRPEFKRLFDKHIPDWRLSNLNLRRAENIPNIEVWQAHQKIKKQLIKLIKTKTGKRFNLNIFTIGFARRFTAYKRAGLLFTNPDKLLEIHKKVGAIQIVFAGKAHPNDLEGQKILKGIIDLSNKFKNKIKIAFLENYDMDIAHLIVNGSDLWLNTPLPPNEASATSGMKAAHNGVPQLSTLDGWWYEGYLLGKTGWTISYGAKNHSLHFQGKNINRINRQDANSIYNLLSKEIIPLYYQDKKAWQQLMKNTISINASYFNTERVVLEYISKAYMRKY